MYYILAKEIVDKCLELDLLQEINGSIPIWESASPVDPERYPEGWVLYPKEDVIHMVMDNEEAQKNLQDALLGKGVSMSERKAYWDNMLKYSPFH